MNEELLNSMILLHTVIVTVLLHRGLTSLLTDQVNLKRRVYPPFAGNSPAPHTNLTEPRWDLKKPRIVRVQTCAILNTDLSIILTVSRYFTLILLLRNEIVHVDDLDLQILNNLHYLSGLSRLVLFIIPNILLLFCTHTKYYYRVKFFRWIYCFILCVVLYYFIMF